MNRPWRTRTALALVAGLLMIVSDAYVSQAAVVGKLGAIISSHARNIDIFAFTELHCGGSMSTSTATNENTVGVSYVCQYAVVGSSTWTNHGSPPASTCSTCSGTNYHAVTWTNPCGDLAFRNYKFRAHVDGWWIDGSGVRHDITAINSPTTLEVDCAGPVPSTAGKLAALVSVSGSTASSGPTLSCGGSDSMDAMTYQEEVHVSYVCQKAASGSTTYSNVGSAPQSYELNSSGSDYHAVSKTCSDLGGGTWNVRAHVDGWWIDFNGGRHDLTAINSPTTLTVYC
jgi:hypothetical protein